MLQLVGENINKHRASYGVEQGRLVPIMRGVLVESGDDADAVIFNHAIRIARYLYPKTYLSGYSAEKTLADNRWPPLPLGKARPAHTAA